MFRKIGLILMLCGFTHAACAQENPAPAASREALEQEIKAFHEKKNCSGIIGLFYTVGSEPARKEAFIETIINQVCSNFDREIESIDFQDIPADKLEQPNDFEGRHSQYTLKPEGAIAIEYSKGGPGRLESFSFLYGRHDGKFYLITTRQADSR